MGAIPGLRLSAEGTHPFCAQALTWRTWMADGQRLLAAEGVRVTAKAQRVLKLWRSRSRGRSDLGYLDAHMLDDIAVTREQADRESRKPFWRA